MSIMTHLAHGGMRMGQLGRVALTGASIDLLQTNPGKHIIHGKFGNGAIDPVNPPVPVLVNAPVEVAHRWPDSMGYAMLVDVEVIPMGTGVLGSPGMNIVTGGSLRRIEVTMFMHAIHGSDSYWNSSAAVQIANMIKQGPMRWETYVSVVPVVGTPGAVATSWSDWQGLSANVGRSRSIIPRFYNTAYVLELSVSTNYVIDDYNPATPITLRYNSVNANAVPSGIRNFDGVVTITLNSIASTGVPTLHTIDSTNPTWVSAYTATAGKKGRLIIDYTGSLVTIMGVDLPTNTTMSV